MRNELTRIKQHIGLAETCLNKANREWAYYKNGHPHIENDNSNAHYLASQKAYADARKYAERALEELLGLNEPELEQRAKMIIDKCNHNN